MGAVEEMGNGKLIRTTCSGYSWSYTRRRAEKKLDGVAETRVPWTKARELGVMVLVERVCLGKSLLLFLNFRRAQ